MLQGCTTCIGFLFHLFLGFNFILSYRYVLIKLSLELNKAKCFDFAINYYPFGYTRLITKLCILFTSSILLKISLAKKLEANAVDERLTLFSTRLASNFLLHQIYVLFFQSFLAVFGGSGWTRTIDPRLIKTVL